MRAAVLCVALAASVVAAPACGDDDAGAPAGGAGNSARDASTADAAAPHFTVVEASDPCEAAGYVFDGESDCDVVRCPELSCECPALESVDPGDDPLPPISVTLSGCVPGIGCLSVADCRAVCSPSLELARDACERRMAAAGPQGCEHDSDCLQGECRKERVGSLCVDALGCAEDGHCGEGSACLFDPDSLDPETSFPTALGSCADGQVDSRCYDDGDCVFGRCNGERCTGGAEGKTCELDRHCASGFCRIIASADTGSCVGGERGDPCVDDGDCGSDLHCTGAACFGREVGQHCEDDDHCDSGICISGRCRAGRPGSYCEDDGDCIDGYCVGYQCASGKVLSPCTDVGDCESGLACANRLCSDGAEGTPCVADEDCDVFACVFGLCSEGADGEPCDQDPDCRSGRCANPAGIESGVCTSGAPGTPCVNAGHCVSGTCNGNRVCE